MRVQNSDRPLSPHLQVYKLIPTMVMSIMHRITGAGLYFGMALLVWWLFAAANGENYYNFVNGLLASWFGLIVLFGFTWAFIHHLLGGLKHLVQDGGRALGKALTTRLAILQIIASIVLTLLLWGAAYGLK